jgi:hypothetical protein
MKMTHSEQYGLAWASWILWETSIRVYNERKVSNSQSV